MNEMHEQASQHVNSRHIDLSALKNNIDTLEGKRILQWKQVMNIFAAGS